MLSVSLTSTNMVKQYHPGRGPAETLKCLTFICPLHPPHGDPMAMHMSIKKKASNGGIEANLYPKQAEIFGRECDWNLFTPNRLAS